MVARITALREERHAAACRMRQLVDDADRQGRTLSRIEAGEFDALEAKAVRLEREIGQLAQWARAAASPHRARQHLGRRARVAPLRRRRRRARLRRLRRAPRAAGGQRLGLVPRAGGDRPARLGSARRNVGRARRRRDRPHDDDRYAPAAAPAPPADSTASWVSEGATLSEGLPTISEVVATPRRRRARRRAAALRSRRHARRAQPPDAEPHPVDRAQGRRRLPRRVGLGPGDPRHQEHRFHRTALMGTNGASPTNLDPFADAIGTLEAAELGRRRRCSAIPACSSRSTS